jgi:hypothetical protein
VIRATLTAREAAEILFGEQFFEDDFDPTEAQFESGAGVCAALAEHFGFTAADYLALRDARRSD